MSTFKIKYDVVVSAANVAGKTVEDYVSAVATLNFGRKVCAHLEAVLNGVAMFSLTH